MGKPKRPWLIPVVFAVIWPLLAVVCSVLANWYTESLKPYVLWVWVGVGVLTLASIALATRQSRAQAGPSGETPLVEAENALVVGAETIQDGTFVSGHRSVAVQAEHTSGPVAGRDMRFETHIHRAPAGPPTAIHQLPKPPDDFTGRKAELADLRKKLKQRGVAIAGLHAAGGIGKTALALKLAAELTPSYPDAQIYLDLKGTSPQPLTTADAMAHVVRAWHPEVPLPDNKDHLCALYRSVLSGKRALLLLDNASDAAQAEPLLPPDGCVCLVTSRQHFALPGCHSMNLEVLPPSDARRLITRICPRAADEADALAKVCGYLPIALRLAASALAVEVHMTPSDYLRRLSQSDKKLELIDATLGLSYDLLSKEQQRLWRTLGVFPGTFDVAGAAALWELEKDRALDALGGLFKRSMVDWYEAAGRYGLHDLARVYADARLSEDERTEAQRRHAAHYAGLLAGAGDLYEQGRESVTLGLALFDLERENIETGHRWSAEHGGDDEGAARLSIHYALRPPYVLALRLHPREWITWTEAGLQSARRLKKRRSEANALGNLGIAYHSLGDHRRAIEFHKQALAIAREIGDRVGEGNALGSLGIAYCSLGEYGRAIEFHEQDLAIAREIGDRVGEGNALGNLGTAYCSLGEYRHAIEFYEQRLDIAREIGDRAGESTALGNLGNAYHSLGDHRRAMKLHEQNLAIAREIGDRAGEAIALFNESLAFDELGERGKAVPLAQSALAIFKQIESPHADSVRAELARWQGRA